MIANKIRKAKSDPNPLPETVEDNLLRIAQEAMTNVIKHSQATAVEVELDYGPQNIILRVKDNGKGFDPAHTAGPGEGHFGLLGISERAKRLGAELSVQSRPGEGTLVAVQVNLDREFVADENINDPAKA